MMASIEERTNHDAQASVVCDQCRGHNNVYHFCLDCPGNICSECKVTHCNTNLTRNHIVRHRADPDVRKFRRSKKTFCLKHKGKDYNIYCMNCRVPCCEACKKGHKGHKLANLEDFISKTELEINGMVSDLETDLIPSTEKSILKVEEEMSSYQTALNEVKLSARGRLLWLRQQLDKAEATFFADLEKRQKNDLYIMQEQKLKLAENLEKLKSASERGKTAPINLSIISIKDELSRVSSLRPTLESSTQSLSFCESRFQFPSTFDIIGTVGYDAHKAVSDACTRIRNDIVPKDISPHTKEFRILHRIGGTQGNFVLNGYDDQVLVYDNSKKYIQSYKGSLAKNYEISIDSKSIVQGFSCADFVNYGLHDVLLTDSRNDRILRISGSGNITKHFNTHPMKPFGNDIQQVLVGGRVGVDDLLRPWNIVVFSSDGSMLQKVEKNKTGKSLFSGRINRIKQTLVGEYVVADGSRVMCLSTDWVLKWKHQYDSKYDILALCCDKNNNILVGNISKNAIEMFDQDGQHINTLLTNMNGICKPLSMHVDNRGRLWIGQEKNVLIASYME